MTRVFIAGYYGFGNLGDEAILAGVLRSLRVACPDLRAAVTHGGVGRPQAEPVAWDDLPAIVEAVRAADLVILGGGGIFFDYWPFDPDAVLTRTFAGPSYYATFPLLAGLLGRPLVIWGVGVGPFNSEGARRLTRLSLLQADAATVRDEVSAAALTALGVPPDRFAVAADPAFGLSPAPPETLDRILAAEGIPADRPLVGVVLREWDVGVDPEAWPAEVAAALDRFIRAHDVTLVFIPFQWAEGHLLSDARAAGRVIGRMACADRAVLLRGEYSPEETAALLGRCELVLGMRLHALILGAVGGAPAAALVYDPKVRAAARQLGLEDFTLDLPELSADRLLERLEAAWTARRELRPQVAARARELAERCSLSAALAAEVLAGRRRRPREPEVDAWVREVLVGHGVRLWKAEGAVAELSNLRAVLEARLADQERTIEELRAELARVGQERAVLEACLTDQERAIEGLQAALDRAQQERAALEAQLAGLEARLRWKRYRIADRLVAPLWYLKHPVTALRRIHARLPSLLRRLSALLRSALHRWIQPRGPFRDGYAVEDNSQVILFATTCSLFADYQPRADLVPRPSSALPVQVTLIAPARNEAGSLHRWWEGLMSQTRMPDEIIVVDSGSTDGTAERLRALAAKSPVPFQVIEAPGVNIATGRNLAVRAARYDVIACIDLGCRPRSDWLEKLVAPFELDPEIQVVAGWYEPVRADGRPVRHRHWWPQFHRIWPQAFLPSSRSLAFRREAWEAVGGYPEWLTLTGEDTYFALELKRQGGKWAFVPEAVVEWEAPDSVPGYLSKMFRWSVGDGESGVHALYYWRWAVSTVAFLGMEVMALAVLAVGLGLGVVNPLWAAIPALGGLALAARVGDPAVLAGRAAAVAGFLAGARRRREVQARRWAQVKGVWFILSGVPIDDTGGGARATQVALELLRRGCFVVFISKFPKYESRELGLRFAHPNLETYRVAEFDWARFVQTHTALLADKPVAALVEFPVADFLPIVDRIRAVGGKVVYDLIDDWSTSLGASWYSPEVERRFIDKADVLVATAPVLAERLRNMSGREVHLLPNAVNLRLFDRTRPYPRPKDMPGGDWVMIYIGALWGEWFHWDLLIRLADAYPDAAVVVIGDYRGQCPESRPNLHFLGLKPQRELPAYLAHSHVAIIPWKVNEITLATSPLKVYEYLAMHRPVVAPNLPPLHDIPGVWLASNEDHFIMLAAQVRILPYPSEQVDRFLSLNNWHCRVGDLVSFAFPEHS